MNSVQSLTVFLRQWLTCQLAQLSWVVDRLGAASWFLKRLELARKWATCRLCRCCAFRAIGAGCVILSSWHFFTYARWLRWQTKRLLEKLMEKTELVRSRFEQNHQKEVKEGRFQGTYVHEWSDQACLHSQCGQTGRHRALLHYSYRLQLQLLAKGTEAWLVF